MALYKFRIIIIIIIIIKLLIKKDDDDDNDSLTQGSIDWAVGVSEWVEFNAPLDTI